MTNLATKLGACILPFTLAACGTIGGRTMGMGQQQIANVPEMSQVAAVRDPCNSVGIEAVPQTQVTNLEIQQNLNAGRRVQNHNGYVVFSQEPLAAKFGPLVGGLAGAVAGAAIGGGSVRLIMGTAGGISGALGGELIGKNSRIEYLTDLGACRDYLNKVGPAPIRQFITGQPDSRPINTVPRGLENRGYVVQPGPYSPTSPGGSREFAR